MWIPFFDSMWTDREHDLHDSPYVLVLDFASRLNTDSAQVEPWKTLSCDWICQKSGNIEYFGLEWKS